MRLRPSLLVLPVLAVALLASGCFESRTAGTVSTPITVAVGTTETEVNPAASASTAASTGSTSASTSSSTASTGKTTTTTPSASYPPAAKAKFASTCGGCHTLADAGTHGNVGPNLDDLKPSDAIVAKQIANGGQVMPAGLLKGQDLKDVAAYVSAVAGKAP
jgi:mono/diheme cytochrome c family protein